MITRRKFMGYSAAGAAGALLLPTRSFAQATPAIAKRGGTLAVAIFPDPLNFDPPPSANLQGRTPCRALHHTLVTGDQQGRPSPGPVESVEHTDDKTVPLK